LKRALFQMDAHDHFASPMPGRHRIKNLSTPIKHANASRSTHLVSGEGKEITAHFAHIDWQMAHALSRVHQCKRADSMRLRAEFTHWIDCAEGVRDVGKSKQFY